MKDSQELPIGEKGGRQPSGTQENCPYYSRQDKLYSILKDDQEKCNPV